MNSNSFKKIFRGSITGIAYNILDAGVKFFTIPILIGFYGKEDYGLFALAFSLNAYLRLMEMGMNTGSVRFFSMWFTTDKKNKIMDVARSSIVFYGVIGLINSIIFLIIGFYSNKIFNIDSNQYNVFLNLCYILSASAIFNWTSM